MNKKENIVETRYEKRVKQILIFSITSMFIVFVLSIAGGLCFSLISEEAVSIFVISIFAAFIMFCVIFFPISAKKLKTEKIEYTNFYKTFNEESLFTTFKIFIYYNDNFKRTQVKKPVTIDHIGFRNKDVNFFWQDFRVKVDRMDIYGYAQYSFLLISKKDNVRISIVLNPKTFYLFKNYSGLNVKNIDEIEEWIYVNNRLNNLTKSSKTIPPDAKKFKSYFWLVMIVMVIALILICIPVAVLFTKLGAGTEITQGVLVPIAIVIILPIVFSTPRGTTYISQNAIYNRVLYNEITIDPAKVKITYHKYTIKFKGPLSTVSIYKTKRAHKWLEELNFDSLNKANTNNN